jgi:hypothetical protein
MHNNSLSTRRSYVRKNSIRNTRTISNTQGDTNARKNSIFTPQDARSDLPDLPEVPKQPTVSPQVSHRVQVMKPMQNSQRLTPKKKNGLQGQKKKMSGESPVPSTGNERSSTTNAQSESM